jgi:hypothetical protein
LSNPRQKIIKSETGELSYCKPNRGCENRGLVMRETLYAVAPLAAVIYFVVFPSQFAAMMMWMITLIR